MEQERNGDGFGDDDFEFGGFEAAEPMEANAAPSNVNAGAQAAPNPWVANLFNTAAAGSRNVQPDLLCGQNRFPQHLDNPLTVDVAGSAEASIPPPQEELLDATNGAAGFDPELNFDEDEAPLNLDHISLANDILDGSFRSASSNQSGASILAHGPEQLPDISGFERAFGVSNNAVSRSEPTASNNSEHSVSGPASVSVDGAGCQGQVSEAGSNEARIDRGASAERTNQNVEDNSVVTNQNGASNTAADGAEEVSLMQALVAQANEEKEKYKNDLEQQVLESSRLQEDLDRARQLAEEAQQNYDKLKAEHEKQLTELRAAGHDALALVVAEYKESVSTTIQQQRLACEQTFIQKLQQEMEKFQEMLRSQKEDFDKLQVVERKRNEDKLDEAVGEMRNAEKAKFEQYLEEERQKSRELLQHAVKKEKESSEKAMQKVIEEERQKAQELLEQEQAKLKHQMSTETSARKEEIQKALKESKNQHQEELSSMLEEERGRGRESVQRSVQSTRDDMNRYLEEQRQTEHAVQRRQLASLDVFLESARHQLTLLMSDTTAEGKEESEKTSSSSDSKPAS